MFTTAKIRRSNKDPPTLNLHTSGMPNAISTEKGNDGGVPVNQKHHWVRPHPLFGAWGGRWLAYLFWALQRVCSQKLTQKRKMLALQKQNTEVHHWQGVFEKKIILQRLKQINLHPF